jgi:hypothetical protein
VNCEKQAELYEYQTHTAPRENLAPCVSYASSVATGLKRAGGWLIDFESAQLLEAAGGPQDRRGGGLTALNSEAKCLSHSAHYITSGVSKEQVGLRLVARLMRPAGGGNYKMPRYYFHLRHTDTLVSDDDGQELADVQAARIAALEIADDLLNEYAFSGVTDDPGRQIEVADASGQTVVIVPVERVANAEPTA